MKMNKKEILKDIIEFAELISETLNLKDLKIFKTDITLSINDYISDKYSFLNKVINICHRKNIGVPKSMGNFLLYDEDLQKDIIYSFALNLKLKSKDSNI